MDLLDAIFEPDYLDRMGEKLEAIAEEIGPEAKAFMDRKDSSATLFLTEAGAGQLLRMCGAGPIPQNRLPSLAQDDEDWAHRCQLLSMRLRRALDCGYYLYRAPSKRHPASLVFSYEIYLDQAIEKLGVGEDTSSNLGELLI